MQDTTIQIPPWYKLTEVGVIPQDWEVVKLWDCLWGKPEYGINAPSVKYSDNLPTYLRITDISDDGKFISSWKTSVKHIDSSKFQLKSGDIVFARTGASVWKSYLYNPKDWKLVYAWFLIKVQPKDDILKINYLRGYLNTKSYWNRVTIMSMRSWQPWINWNEYGSLSVPLPPTLREQQSIAMALTDINNLISELNTLIIKKQSIKQWTMQQLLTGKKRLPGFSGEWEEKELVDIAIINKWEQFNKSLLEVNWPYPCMNGGIEPSWYTTKFNTRPNTITISEWGNSCGYVNFITKNFWCGWHCYTLKIINDDMMNKLFLFYVMKFNEPQIMSLRVGSWLPNIQKKNLYTYKFQIPPTVQEQETIAQFLSDMDNDIQNTITQRDKYKLLKQGMMQQLLTGKIRLKTTA